jgi:hypothetical protein
MKRISDALFKRKTQKSPLTLMNYNFKLWTLVHDGDSYQSETYLEYSHPFIKKDLQYIYI